MGFEPHPDRRVTVVTGASAGIGEATARAFAALGHPVALGARRLDRCEFVANEIRAAGGEAIAGQLDVKDTDSVKRFAEDVVSQLGEPEIIVSNAGTVTTRSTLEASTDQIAEDLEVNVLGAHRLIAQFLPGMVERHRGDVVFVSSDVVHAPRPGVAGYMTGKHGLEGLAQSLQMDLEGTGVRASIVRPGPTLTEIAYDWERERTLALFQEWKKWGVNRHHGLLMPADVASAVVAVVSVPRGTHLALVEVLPEAPVKVPPEISTS